MSANKWLLKEAVGCDVKKMTKAGKLTAKEKLQAKVAFVNGEKGTMLDSMVKSVEVLVFTYRQRKCIIMWTQGHYCVYAETKLHGREYSEGGYQENEDEPNKESRADSWIDCHGGVTFSGTLDGHDEWFFGIDFAHYGDFIEGMDTMTSAGIGVRKWSLEDVKQETVRLCKNTIKYEAALRVVREKTRIGL
jgi:hypothetical protein